MASLDLNKANENFNKFCVNLRKVALLTKDVSLALIEISPEFQKKYTNIPDLLEIGVLALESISNDEKVAMLRNFVKKSLGEINGVPLWEKIKSKDSDFLANNLGMIIPGNEYIDKIQYAYGKNPESKIYVDERMLKSMWLIVHGLIHNSLKYIIFSGDRDLYEMVMSKSPVEFWNLNLQ